jgi:CheY-like chemotaxis protein
MPPPDLPPGLLQPAAPPRPDEGVLDADWARHDAAGAGQRAGRHAVATVSHEIRTPLAAIVGLADLLAVEALTPSQAALVRAIGVSGRSLLSLVDDLLDVTRADAGRLVLRPAPTPLVGLLEDLTELIAPRAQAKGLELALSVAGPLPATVTVDADRLRQILLNLIGNAVKFTERGGVELSVAARVAGRGRWRLAFTVTDTGPGIDPDDEARVFAAFEQLGAAGNRAGGVGLGLAIARALTEAMGGRIRLLRRRAAGGARFAVDLTLPGEPPVPPSPPRLVGRAVLLVAAGRFEPTVWSRAVAGLGATVDRVETVWDARQALGRRRYDALLVDNAGGVEAVDLIGAIGPDHPPAVVMVSAADRPLLGHLTAAGFAGHLTKPVRRAAFERVLPAVIEARALDSVRPSATRAGRLPLSVLVAEDDEIAALLARTLLMHLGARPEIVTDGPAALAAWRAAAAAGRPHDLALIDLQLPRLDGTEVIRALRADPAATALRILAMSADPGRDAADAARQAGADDCLVKPLDPDTLVAAAGRAVAG